MQVGFEALCTAHKITFSRSVFDSILGIMKRIALHRPPASALLLTHPPDAALVDNLGLLLQTGTAGGGMSSRSPLMSNTIAVAVEMLRDETLNVFAACLRHSFKMTEFGRSFNDHILERVTAVKDRIAELGLLQQWGQLTTPIDRHMVSAVQMRCKVPVADAAAAVATHGESIDSACDRVREVLGLAPPIDATAMERSPPSPTRPDVLRRLQAMLKRGSCPPSLKSVQIAVHLCADRTAEEEEQTFAAHGLEKKEQRPRIIAYRDRIKEQQLLQQCEQAAEADAPAETATASPPPTDSADGASFSTPARDAGVAHASTTPIQGKSTAATAEDSVLPQHTRPLHDPSYLTKLQERIGVRPPMFHGGKVALPSLECVAAAADMRLASLQGNRNDADVDDICAKHNIPLAGTYVDRQGRTVARSNQGVYTLLRDLVAMLTKLALLDVEPEVLDIVPPTYEPSLLASLQMRLQFHSTPTAVDSILVALDLYHRPELDLISVAVSRRLDVGGKPHMVSRMQRVREQLAEMLAEQPYEASVSAEAVERVRMLVKRSGLNLPSVGLSARAVVEHGSDLHAACNYLRAQMGEPPMSNDALEAITNELNGGAATTNGSDGPPPLERPPPISDELLKEIRRRVALRLKRSEQYLADPKFFRAAADLLSPALREEAWTKFRESDIVAVCEWHGIKHLTQRKAHFDRLKEVRNFVKQLGPLEHLLGGKEGGRLRPKAGGRVKDETMHRNLQLLLQTATSPPNLAAVVVAVEWCRDESIDVASRCVAHAMADPCSKACFERVRSLKERIIELKLLDRPKINVPIDRELVDEVRSKLKASIALAAAAVLRHGSNVKAACEQVREQLGITANEEQHEAAVSESEGVQLFLSERTATGYMGVSRNASGKFFEARCSAGERAGSKNLIGTFGTAVEAAVAYARFRTQSRQQGGEQAEEGEEEVGAAEEEKEEEEEEEEETEETRVPIEILADGGDGGDGGRNQRWLVRFEESSSGGGTSSERIATRGGKDGKAGSEQDADQAWVGASRIPTALLEEYVERRRVEFNMRFEPLLKPSSDHPSGVVCVDVEAPDALKLALHFKQQWRDGALPLGGVHKAFGWTTYGKTLSPHDAEQQRVNTMLLTNVMLPAARKHLPGFGAMELSLTKWINDFYSTDVELFYAHGLRQGPLTQKSTGFDVHQDTEDFDFIVYTVVVKLTPDVPGEAPSQMRVVGAQRNFQYGAPAGSAGAFRARVFHASVAPAADTSEHLKIAFFFKASSKGERRAKRVHASAGMDEAEARRHVALELSNANFDAQKLRAERGEWLPGELMPRGIRPPGGFQKVDRCGKCEGCSNLALGKSVNCGKCRWCRDMPENGGPGRSKMICELRYCEAHPNSRKRRLEREAEAEDDEQPATDDTMVPEEPICELCE